MPRLTVCLSAIVIGTALSAGVAPAQPDMKPTAPTKMMPPGEKARMEACQQKATRRNVKMDERAKFVMDCMKEMAK